AFYDSIGEHGFVLHDNAFLTLNVTGTIDSTGCGGINDHNLVVGTYFDSSRNQTEGFITNFSGYVELHDPDGTTTFPNAINNSNRIVGSYSDFRVNALGFLATP